IYMIYQEYLPFVSLLKQVDKKEIKLPFPLEYTIEKIEKIKKINPQFLILESHFSDVIPEKYIDYGFILRCDPDELFKRLEKKNFELKKIIENVQTEILGNCVNFFIQKQVKAPLFEIDTTSLSIESVAKIIISIVVEKKDLEKHYIGKVDWIEKLFQENRLEEFFD
ncbi:hypothetical protein LCGC14_1667780, partial [marine sediment metagenome]